MNKFRSSLRYAIRGFFTAIRSETNLRIHLVVAVIVCAVGFWLQLSIPEWIAIVICIAVVFGFELMNTAIEHLCDLVTKEQHPTIKTIKDIAAAAVLIVCLGSIVIGVIIFLPKLIHLI